MTAIDERIELPLPAHGHYDAAECLICREIASPGYHTRLRSGMVHPTRESLDYAADLCASASDPALDRAAEIIDRVIGLQDQDPDSPTWGIWSWYLEESLSEMAPPDWNWADFCGALLLEIASKHGERLDASLLERMNTAIRHAAGSVRRRNVNLDYTNIAVLGTYVTLHAGEHLEWPEMTAYALDRLRRFFEFTETNGAFTEYNSPTYTTVTLEELNRLRAVAPEGEPARMAEALYRRAWEEVANHFHPPTEQWAGPHSRCYSTLLTPQHRTTLEQAAAGRLRFRSMKNDSSLTGSTRSSLNMPADLVDRFKRLSGPTQRTDVFESADVPIIGTTYLHPKLALGSVNHANLWRQQRPLLAYWGTATAPSYLRVRFLRDGDDFHAAHLSSVQNHERVLSVLRFATDGGIVHPFFDRLPDGVVEAADLRLRFEIGGASRDATVERPKLLNDPIVLRLGSVTLAITVAWAEFDACQAQWQLSKTEEASCFDLILYHGRPKQIDLKRTQGLIGFGTEFMFGDGAAAAVSLRRLGEEFSFEMADLRLQATGAPAPLNELRRQCGMWGGALAGGPTKAMAN